MKLNGRVAVVTGGASGIGAACARRFVAEGARVVLGDLNEAGLAAMREELGDVCATEVTDVTNEADVERLVARALSEFGHVDLGLNAAGLGTVAPVHAHPLESWDLVFDVCVKGVMLSTKHESAAMLQHGSGVIINLASINSVVPSEGMSAYCSAKAAVAMYTKCAGMELAPHGIRVVAIGPGLVETPLTSYAKAIPAIEAAYIESIPMGRTGNTTDIANAALFLASDEASWVTATTFYVDGGESTKSYPNLAKLSGM